VYTVENVDRALDIAARSFCSQEVKVSKKSKSITLSQLFLWYRKDFAPKILDFVEKYLTYALRVRVLC
jgi:hypothetical protein